MLAKKTSAVQTFKIYSIFFGQNFNVLRGLARGRNVCNTETCK